MRPAPIPMPFGVPAQRGTGAQPLPLRGDRDTSDAGRTARRHYRRIRRDLEPFFRRLEKQFRGRE